MVWSLFFQFCPEFSKSSKASQLFKLFYPSFFFIHFSKMIFLIFFFILCMRCVNFIFFPLFIKINLNFFFCCANFTCTPDQSLFIRCETSKKKTNYFKFFLLTVYIMSYFIRYRSNIENYCLGFGFIFFFFHLFILIFFFKSAFLELLN